MKTSLHPADPTSAPADAAVLFVRAGKPRPAPVAPPADRGLRGMVERWLAESGFRAEAGEATVFPTWRDRGPRRIVLAGVGEGDAPPAWRYGRAAAGAARLARRARLASLAFPVEPPAGATAVDLARAVVLGTAEGQYRFERFASEPPIAPAPPLARLLLCGARPSGSVRAAAAEAVREAAALDEVRELANLPGNEAPPVAIAEAARSLARRAGLGCEVWDRRALERRGCRALLAVARGSRREPRLVVLRHRAGRRARPVAWVGKTITFDSGGLSLKPPKGMEWMKYDKSGGMAVLAATVAAARLDLPTPVVAVLAVAENMPGGGATRPGDIVRSLAGPSIEIVNTDAEGRLVLADALALCAAWRPRAIVDLATLTGAVIVALGHAPAAVLGTDDALAGELRAAGERTGERLWPLPLWPEYEADLRSPFADLKNVGDGSAGTIVGAAFLRRFVPEGVPWAHLDIAGTAWEEKDRPWRGAGATLFGARLLVDWLRHAGARRGEKA